MCLKGILKSVAIYIFMNVMRSYQGDGLELEMWISKDLCGNAWFDEYEYDRK